MFVFSNLEVPLLFHPTILALYAGSLMVSFLVLYALPPAWQVWRHWDLDSGSEEQLAIERKTYLISTLLAYAFAFELLSLFLYIFTAEQLHTYFVGAMCAAGSLYVNAYGYPTLILRLINFLLVGLWLIVNYVDNRAPDYPLIRKKYLFFLLLAPLILLETALQAGYFLHLKADVITSCCGSLFSSGSPAVPSSIEGLPALPARTVFFTVMGLTIATGFYARATGRDHVLFALFSALACAASFLAIFAFLSQYIYELPTHACPFCILQREYYYIGYPLYLFLLGGTVTGIGAGILRLFKGHKSLTGVIPPLQAKLVLTATLLFLVFTVLATLAIWFSNLEML
jgi:hypothetical protein